MAEDNKLIKIAQEQGLEENKIQDLMRNYGKAFAEARALVEGAMDIKVKDENDFEGMEKARERRLALRRVRIGVEDTRKSLKEQSLREGRAIDGAANIIKALVGPAEEYLLGQEKYAEELAKQHKITIEQERIIKLSKYVNTEGYSLHPDQMNNDTFKILLKNSRIAYGAQLKAEQDAEDLQKQEAEKKRVEDGRIRKENDKLKIIMDRRDELAEFGVLSVSVDLSEISDKDFNAILEEAKKDYDKREKQDEAKSKEQEKLQNELDQKNKEDVARKQKEADDAQAKRDEEHQKALAPDKDKIIALADELAKIEIPAVKDARAMQVLVTFKEAMKNVENDLRESVKIL